MQRGLPGHLEWNQRTCHGVCPGGPSLSVLQRAMSDTKAHILVVDDDVEHARAVTRVLEREGWSATMCHHADQALAHLRETAVNVVITDLKMPGKTGFELVRAAEHLGIAPDFIVMTAFGTVDNAIEALRSGAEDFIVKPIKRAALVKAVRRILRRQELEQENAALRQQLAASQGQTPIIGSSNAIQAALRRANQAARSDATVLLLGESGTGKELFARAIHDVSERRDKSFVTLHCAALPEGLIESELFGHEAGAFTGAGKAKPGLVERSDKGTLFLDEVGELPLAVQVKLLRLLQEGEYTRVGGVHTRRIDARIIAATHRDLSEMVRQGSFREDLFYRLNVIPIEVPALRERGQDVIELASRLLARHAESAGRPQLRLSREAQTSLMRYRWPGNVRELDNVMQRVALMSSGDDVRADDLPAELSTDNQARSMLTFPVGTPLAEVEREMILATLAYAGGDKALTASLLGVGRRTIYRKLDEYEPDATRQANASAPHAGDERTD